jgi:hypothetical protein
MGETLDITPQRAGTLVSNTEGEKEHISRSSILLQMDKHRRMCQERHDIYLCEVNILAGLRKTQSIKLRELNEIKAKVTLSK